jgi:hypothetical protein
MGGSGAALTFSTASSLWHSWGDEVTVNKEPGERDLSLQAMAGAA